MSIKRNLELVDRTALKELLGAFGMYKSDRQKEALKSNSSLMAYGEAVETMLDAFGLSEQDLRDMLIEYDSDNSKERRELNSKFRIVGTFSRPSNSKHNGKKCRDVGFTIMVPEDNNFTIEETMKFVSYLKGE